MFQILEGLRQMLQLLWSNLLLVQAASQQEVRVMVE